MSTSGEATSASAGSGPSATITLTTPGGKPASSHTSARRTMARGSCGAGFTTTVLPIARAGPSFPAMLTSGKLYEVMHATTPTGARCTTPPMIPPGVATEAGRDARHLHGLGDPHRRTGLGLHERDELLVALVEEVGRSVEQ